MNFNSVQNSKTIQMSQIKKQFEVSSPQQQFGANKLKKQPNQIVQSTFYADINQNYPKITSEQMQQQSLKTFNLETPLTIDTTKRYKKEQSQILFELQQKNKKIVDKAVASMSQTIVEKGQQHQPQNNKIVSFGNKMNSQFEVNLSELTAEVKEQITEDISSQGLDKHMINFTRFTMKEGSKKKVSQSQLLFEQLKKKTQTNYNNLNTSGEIAKEQEYKKKGTISSQTTQQTAQQSACYSDRIVQSSIQSVNFLSSNQSIKQDYLDQQFQQLKNSCLISIEASSNKQISPRRKVNKQNASLANLDNFIYGKEQGSKVFNEQAVQIANLDEKLTSTASFPNIINPNINQSLNSNHKIEKKGSSDIFQIKTNQCKPISQTENIFQIQQSQQIIDTIKEKRNSSLGLNYQKSSSINLTNNNSQTDKISLNLKKIQEQYIKNQKKIENRNGLSCLASPILQNNDSSSTKKEFFKVDNLETVIQRQREILSRRQLKNRRETTKSLKEMNINQNQIATNAFPLENQILNEVSLQNRTPNKLDIKIPVGQFRSKSITSQIINQNEQSYLSQTFQNLACLPDEPSASPNKLKKSQFRYSSQTSLLKNFIAEQNSPGLNKNINNGDYNHQSILNIGTQQIKNKEKLTPIEQIIRDQSVCSKNSKNCNDSDILHHINTNSQLNIKQQILPQNINQSRKSYQTIQQNIWNEVNISSSVVIPTCINHFNVDSEDDQYNSLQNIHSTNSQTIIHNSQLNHNTNSQSNMTNSQYKASNYYYNSCVSSNPHSQKNIIKQAFDKSQEYNSTNDCKDDSPCNYRRKSQDILSSENQGVTINCKSQNQISFVRNQGNNNQNVSNILNNQRNTNQFTNSSHSNNNSSNHILPNITTNQNKNSSIFLKINQKTQINSSFNSSNDLSPIYPIQQSSATAPKKGGFSTYHQNQVQSQKKINDNEQIMQKLSAILINYFENGQFKNNSLQTSNIKFSAQVFTDFLNKVIQIHKQYDSENQVSLTKQKNKKTQNIVFSFEKEQMKIIGITPILLEQIVKEIQEYLEQLIEKKELNGLNFEIISEVILNIETYIKQHFNWNLLDYFGSQNELKELSLKLYKVFLSDPLCMKMLNIFKIDENNIIGIINSAFQNDYIEEDLQNEIKLKMQEYGQSCQKNQNCSQSDITYADFFYIKYKITYFCMENQISMKIIFEVLEIFEKTRHLILKKSNSIDSLNYDSIGFQLKNIISQNSNISQILSKQGIMGNKLESILGNVTKSILERSISFYPIKKIPREITSLFSCNQDILSQICNGILKLMHQDYKCEKYIFLDSKRVLSTLKVIFKCKISFNDSLISKGNINFEEILNKLHGICEENQVFAPFSSLSNPLNTKIFILNLLCYFFDIFEDDHACQTYTQDIQALFKMFGCSFVAFNEFLIITQTFLTPLLPASYLDDFIQNSCKDLKGLDIFD